MENKRVAERPEELKSQESDTEDFLASTRELLKKNKEILEQTNLALIDCRSTVQRVQNTEKKLQTFIENFDNIMTRALSSAFTGHSEDLSQYGSPVISTVDQVSDVISRCSKLAILTGAGVSAESGVFTYKSNEETYMIGGRLLKLQQIMSSEILEWFPLEFWQHIQLNRKRISSYKANAVHQNLFNLIKRFRQKARKISLITQNIDGFDRPNLRNDPDFYELHGNINEMRCKAICCDILRPCPSMQEELVEIPICSNCGSIMRPNVLLYGETYTELFYRAETAVRAVQESEALVVVGTQLGCLLPARMVREVIKKKGVVVEINTEPVVGFGEVYVVRRRCGEAVPQIVQRVCKGLS